MTLWSRHFCLFTGRFQPNHWGVLDPDRGLNFSLVMKSCPRFSKTLVVRISSPKQNVFGEYRRCPQDWDTCAMFLCESCGEEMGKLTGQRSRRRPRQEGVVTRRGNNAKPSQRAQANSQTSKTHSTSRSGEPPSEDQKWAKATLASLGFLWGSDLAEKLTPAVNLRAQQLNPKAGTRWWWHSGSFAILVLGFALGLSPDLAVVSSMFAFLWLASILSHAWFAFKAWTSRDDAIGKTLVVLRRALEDELSLARLQILRNGPFGPSKRRPPRREPKGVNDKQAEHLCAEWLSHLGEENASVTRAGSDGGIDIVSSRCVAQVKNYRGSVGVVPVRELVGVASVDGRFPVFFTSGQYTRAALQFAEDARVYLFRYDAEAGTLDGESSVARKALA